jgi:hypothetical protein
MPAVANPSMTTLAGPGFTQQPTTGGNAMTNFVQSAEDTQATQGQSLAGQGAAGLAPVMSYLQKLVGGNAAAVSEATQPETDQITQSFDQIRKMISSMPRGGGKASAEVTAPYQEAKQISTEKAAARTSAVGQLGSLSTTLAGLGLNAEQVAAAQALEQRGQNIQSTGQLEAMIGGLGQGIGSIIGGKLASS